ncbi:ComEC/Rec2 family competence protein [Mycoplasma sp. Pen4]|uniref:ComEC/Rec2 family competence protein n=1 Tax=Mycoplasma sp. Pen4 TaxID=640330 RepID=UPI00165437DD|nr:ComEC/Rec2 family competence protein [Mycoplasma sp. Pen4]QNM93311.1 ComEC/Rec2 family competence protein [Mycoplasma sp. Pen4]
MNDKTIVAEDWLLRKVTIHRKNINFNPVFFQWINLKGILSRSTGFDEGSYLVNLPYFVNSPNVTVSSISNYDLRVLFFSHYWNKTPEYHKLVIPLIFGFAENSSNALAMKLSEMGVVHLIVVSSLHFMTIFTIIYMLFSKIDKRCFLVFIFITIYFLFTKKGISVIRSYFMLTLLLFPKMINKPIKINFQMWLFIFGVVYLCAFPYAFMSLGFWISVVLSFITKKYFSGTPDKKPKIQIFKDYLFIWFITSSLIYILKQQISLLSLLFNIVFIPYFEVLIVLMLLFFPFVEINNLLTNLTIHIIDFAYNGNILLMFDVKIFSVILGLFSYRWIISIYKKKTNYCIIKLWN